MQIFKWNAEKNEVLARERGITFEEIVKRIELGAKIIETDHTNKKKYPNQKILKMTSPPCKEEPHGKAFLIKH